MFLSFAKMKGYLLFWLTFLSLIGVTVYAYTKTDSSALNLIPVILGIYATHSFGRQVSAHVNSRLDVDADVEKIVETTKES